MTLRAALDQFDAVGVVGLVHELEVGLVQDHDHFLGQGLAAARPSRPG